MKRYMTPTKRTRISASRLKDLKKPFGFCCDICHQDPETQYDMRNPPFESSFAKTPLVTNRPDVQFRVQDNVKIPVTIPRIIGIYREDVEIKKAATYGRSKKGRGPLAWFLEDEIEAARDALAEEKKAKWEEMHEQHLKKPKKYQDIDKITHVQENDNGEIIETENPTITETK